MKEKKAGKVGKAGKKVARIKGAGKVKGLEQGLSQEQLQRFYLRFLYGTNEAGELSALLEEREQTGKRLLFLRQNLERKEKKCLKKSLKLIKRNKKGVKTIQLVGILVIISAFVIFNIFFKNRLVEWGIEKGLSHLTGASVECDGAYLEFRGELGFRHLAVANPEDLDFNLVELGRTKLDISVWQLLQRKVVINELRGEELLWNTPRKTKGVRTRPLTQAEKEAEGKPFDLGAELALAGLEPDDLFAQAKKQFVSLQAAEDLGQQVGEEWVLWPGKVDTRVKEVEALAQEIQAIDLDSVTLQNAPILIQKGQRIVPQAVELTKKIDGDIRTLDKQIQTSVRSLDQIVKNFDSDLAKFKNQISSGELLGFPVSKFLEQYVYNKLFQIGLLNNNIMAMLDRFDRLKNREKEENKLRDAGVQADVDRTGRDYYFPLVGYPSFVIQKVYFSLGKEDAQPYMRFEVNDISNDADIMGYPVVGHYLGIDGGVATEARFLLENRSKVRQLARCQSLFADVCGGLQNSFAEFELRDQPFALDKSLFDEIQIPYIHSYSGSLLSKLRLEQIGQNTRAFAGSLSSEVYDVALTKDDNLDLLQSTIVSVFENNDVKLGAGFELDEDGAIKNLSVDSNIEDILKNELQRLQERALKAALAEVERRLRSEFGAELGPLRDALAKLKQYKGLLTSADKRAEAQKEFSKTIERRVKQELEKHKKAAVEKAKKSLGKEIQKALPKLPF